MNANRSDVDPWAVVAWATADRAAAIRYACWLEVTAPKPGNVHPAARFADLSAGDFVAAMEIVADELTATQRSIGRRVLRSIRRTREETGTNVNLGIVLLLAPLIAAEERFGIDGWRPERMQQVLRELSDREGRLIGRAIGLAAAGGVRDRAVEDSRLDVSGPIDEAFDLLEAMKQAAPIDAIAALYVNDFQDLTDRRVNELNRNVRATGDVISGIVLTQLRWLAADGDSLIIRKCGAEVSEQVQRRTERCLDAVEKGDTTAIQSLDRWLRADGHALNPGTTADLMAASLYIVLRRAGSADKR